MHYNISVGAGSIQSSNIVLKESTPVLRVTLDYTLEQDDNAAFRELIAKYAQPVLEGSDGPRFVLSPLRAGNTFAAYMCDDAHSDDPVPLYMRIIDKFNFIARFAVELDKKGVLAVTPHRYNQDAGNTLNIDKLLLPIPEPYAAVLIVTNDYVYAPTLLGLNKKEGTIFRIPTPNMHWENASLCMGGETSDALHNAIPSGDILAINAAFDSWEASEWNADLTQSLPADASEFLKWDVLGRYKGNEAWAAFEKKYPVLPDGRNVEAPMVNAAMFARSLAV